MTTLEKKFLKLTQQTSNLFMRLPVFDKRLMSDQADVTYHIRALQNIILSRDNVRKMKRLKPTKP